MKTEEALLLVGGIAVVGLIAYFVLSKPLPTPPGLSTEITEIALY